MIRINNTQYFHFLQEADALRRSGSLCDVIISVKSHIFKAHRLVLACASRRLAQQLAQAATDSSAHCTLEYFSPRTFQQVLDFTYTQTLEVTEGDLHLLLRAAQLLEMQLLEDQCLKQLGKLNYREVEADRREIPCFKDEEQDESAEKNGQKQSSSPVEEEKLQETSSPEEEANDCIVMENLSPCDPDKNPNSLPPQKKKLKRPPVLESSPNRERVTRPASSSATLSSPWTFPPNMWSSVSTLRRIAGNYSSLIAAHPLQSQSPSSIAYPFPLSSPHMFPLLGAHFQTPVHSSVMGYSNFHPSYTHNLYARSSGVGSIIKQGLLKRKKNSQRGFTGTSHTGERSYHEVPKASRERVKDCQRCCSTLHDNPTQREPASTPSGEACAGCRVCGRGDVVQHEPQSHQQEHRGEKPYQCQHCPKKFSLKHQLDTHHRVHTGEKPFECRLCGQRSRDYSAMIKHLRTHGGATPYQCTVCLEFCNSLVSMQRHVKSHAVQDFPPDWSINSTYLYNSHI
ncbi:zinc finger and BTB domain-containing protein 32 [Trematomus bernacchii]|uniref:zinc finger and BTB domain-containing protein 32 n=1 Tax=Trematomus bernacchii TaxID=40690 RepID=UPI00146AA2B6|nr:zinc finger and BTB domain-containing protein 32 [Trematomus bernacchii]XP_033983481.1 zinc finger and BTB domain-containing protein 32 [Trematomus bernacchii]